MINGWPDPGVRALDRLDACRHRADLAGAGDTPVRHRPAPCSFRIVPARSRSASLSGPAGCAAHPAAVSFHRPSTLHCAAVHLHSMLIVHPPATASPTAPCYTAFPRAGRRSPRTAAPPSAASPLPDCRSRPRPTGRDRAPAVHAGFARPATGCLRQPDAITRNQFRPHRHHHGCLRLAGVLQCRLASPIFRQLPGRRRTSR